MELLVEGKVFTSMTMASEEMSCQRATLVNSLKKKGWYLYNNQLAHLSEMVVTKDDVAKIIITDTDTGEMYYYMRETEAANLLEMAVSVLCKKMRLHKWHYTIGNYEIHFRAWQQAAERKKQKVLRHYSGQDTYGRIPKELRMELERNALFEQKRKQVEALREQAKKEACRGSNCPFKVCNGLRCSRVNKKIESLLKEK